MKNQSDIFNSTIELTHEFWENPGNRNRPKDYAAHKERSKFLINNVFSKLKTKKDAPILEIGCNCGRNLKFLQDDGYTNLTGIDISQEAIDYSKKVYPELNAYLIVSPIEEIQTGKFIKLDKKYITRIFERKIKESPSLEFSGVSHDLD